MRQPLHASSTLPGPSTHNSHKPASHAPQDHTATTPSAHAAASRRHRPSQHSLGHSEVPYGPRLLPPPMPGPAKSLKTPCKARQGQQGPSHQVAAAGTATGAASTAAAPADTGAPGAAAAAALAPAGRPLPMAKPRLPSGMVGCRAGPTNSTPPCLCCVVPLAAEPASDAAADPVGAAEPAPLSLRSCCACCACCALAAALLAPEAQAA